MLSSKAKISYGFTIVELVVALSVSAMALATGYELFTTLRTVGNKQDQFMANSRQIINGLDQIREDLVHAIPKADEQGEAMFVGDNVAFGPEAEASKLLQFYSLCVADQFNGICGTRQIYRIVYEVVNENDSISLYRVVRAAVDKDTSTGDPNKKLIFGEIDEMKIFFYDGRELQPSFSSEQNLPVYVELELTAFDRVWPLTVKLPCNAANVESAL